MRWKITAAKIANYYATRGKLGGSDTLTDREQRLLMLAHGHHFGIVGDKRLSVAQVREFVAWAAVHGSAVEREAVTA